jgi:phosphoesterase RecJ-like protein
MITTSPVFDRVINLFVKFEKILLVIHQSPDGDAIASSLALARALLKLNKIVAIVSKDPVPATFQFLPDSDTIGQDFFQGDWDLIVVMDCGDLKRTGFPTRIKDFASRRKRLINIDHHPKNDLHKIANINLFDTTASSTGEIVARIIDGLNINIDKEIATCLLTALYTDTGGFKHSNTSQKTLELASRLMLKGARLKTITQHISNTKTVSSLKLWGVVLSRLHNNRDLNMMVSLITQKDLKECAATFEDLAGAVNLIGSVPGTKVAMLLAEQNDGQIKGSLRTEADNVDVSKIAQIFGGGGHKKASGFLIHGKIFKDRSKWRIMLKSN